MKQLSLQHISQNYVIFLCKEQDFSYHEGVF